MEPLKETLGSSEAEYLQDAWEAYKSFRMSRCLFFWLTLVGLLFIQASFWVIHSGVAGTAEEIEGTGTIINLQGQEAVLMNTGLRNEEEVDAQASLRDYVYKVLKIFYYVLSFSVVLYCLSLLFGFKLALVGRLGGLADSSRAFFLSLVVLVLVVPWYETINAGLPGTLFTYETLITKYRGYGEIADWWGYALYFGHFVGLWVLTFLLLLACQWRGFQATKKIRLRLIHGQQSSPSSIVAAAAEVRKNSIAEALEEDKL